MSLGKKLLAVGVCLAALMIAVLVVVSVPKLEVADQLASVCGGVLALYGFIAGAVVIITRGRQPVQATGEKLDAAAGALAEAVRDQWQAEATRRGVRGVPLADMRWTVDGAVTGDPGPLPDRIARAWHEHDESWLYVQGDPGSGKSTFAILLTLQLLAERHQPGVPVPVLLSAASWNPSQAFTDWVAARLRDTYPFLEQRETYGDRAAESLVTSPRVLVILDGLDELVGPRQEEAMGKLVQSYPDVPALVITSRLDPVPRRLDAGRAAPLPGLALLRLCRLEADAAVRFLEAADLTGPRPALSPGTAGRRWFTTVTRSLTRRLRPPTPQPVEVHAPSHWAGLTAVLQADTPLRQVLTVPLYAALARRLYNDSRASPVELAEFRDAEALKEHLVSGFIAVAFRVPLRRDGQPDRHGAPWGTQRVQRGMRAIAAYFIRNDPTEPDSLQWWRLESSVGIHAWTVTAAIVAGLLYGLTDDLPSGLRRGAALGFITAVLIQLSRGRLSGRGAAWRLGLSTGAGVAVVGWYQIGLVPGVIDGVELGVGVAVCIWYAAWITRGLRWALGVAAVTGLHLGVLMGLLDGWLHGAGQGALRLLTTGVGVIFSVGMPLCLIHRFGAHRSPDQPGRLNLGVPQLRPLTTHVVVGVACGLGVGLGGALIGGIRYAVAARDVGRGLTYAARVGATYGISVGLGIGLVGGLVHYLTLPSGESAATDPRTTLRTSRTVAWCYLLVPAMTCALVLHLLTLLQVAPAAQPGAPPAAVVGGGLGLSLGLVFASAFTPWPTFVVVQFAAFCRGLPFNIVRLCESARECELLRVEGAVFQLRHDELKRALAAWEVIDITEPVPLPAPRPAGEAERVPRG
ncbi:NACHT domain-containing protein [Actinoplanes sp. N902-109]|uniref:NACHT domain-containing protein n=1 Tax=Actinoplanes sp. (strain N902-109) TaxID=649831 RepID=UPI0003296116|nr:NACHT domain-containing protein [Actinoplanes sp. N902-109]AGL18905.1 hypothetical protein L083_5395 [Actinoplanes sp. N902-109]